MELALALGLRLARARCQRAACRHLDRRLVELAQAGVASSAYEPGPYSPYTESLVEAFCTWYVDRLRAGLGQAR